MPQIADASLKFETTVRDGSKREHATELSDWVGDSEAMLAGFLDYVCAELGVPSPYGTVALLKERIRQLAELVEFERGDLRRAIDLLYEETKGW